MTKTFCDRCGKELDAQKDKPMQRTFVSHGHSVKIQPLVFRDRDWREDAAYCRSCLCAIILDDKL